MCRSQLLHLPVSLHCSYRPPGMIRSIILHLITIIIFENIYFISTKTFISFLLKLRSYFLVSYNFNLSMSNYTYRKTPNNLNLSFLEPYASRAWPGCSSLRLFSMHAQVLLQSRIGPSHANISSTWRCMFTG